MGEADIPKRLVTFPLHLWQLNFIRSFIHSIHYSFTFSHSPLVIHLYCCLFYLLFTLLCHSYSILSLGSLFSYTLSSAIKVCIVALPFPRCV